jgi:glycosyltransferase involved in cell wall biosynthesis
MRIVLVTGIFPPDIGGPASYIPLAAAELAKRGHTVSVLTLADDPARPLAFPFPVTRLARRRFVPLRMAQTILALWRMAREHDIVYANGLDLEALCASRLARKPFVLKIVGDYAWERARNRGWFKGTIDEYQAARKGPWLKALDALRALPARRAERVIVPSLYLRDIVAGWGGVPAERLSVVYNAIADRSGGAEEAESRYLEAVTVCRLVPWKGVEGLVRAVARMPGVRATIAGDGPLREELEALSASLGVRERVRFMGNVPKEEIDSVLARAHCFVLNSTYEGLPHVLLEAMRARIPVIAADVGGTSELVEDGVSGLLIPPRDGDALVAALRRLEGDRGLRARLAGGADAVLADRFSLRRMMADTEALLLQEADRHGRPRQADGGRERRGFPPPAHALGREVGA